MFWPFFYLYFTNPNIQCKHLRNSKRLFPSIFLFFLERGLRFSSRMLRGTCTYFLFCSRQGRIKDNNKGCEFAWISLELILYPYALPFGKSHAFLPALLISVFFSSCQIRGFGVDQRHRPGIGEIADVCTPFFPKQTKPKTFGALDIALLLNFKSSRNAFNDKSLKSF